MSILQAAINKTKALNFILSAIAPVKSKGVITANIISNFTNSTPGMVGAYCSKEAFHGIPLRNVHCKFPASPAVSGPKDKLKPKVNHITLRRAIPKNICIKIETVFFFLSKPASNNPNEGIISKTRLDAISIHAVSPVSIAKSLSYEHICIKKLLLEKKGIIILIAIH
jgi:hypothetical protein